MATNSLILCLETTTEVCSVALSKSGKCIAEISVNEPNVHGTLLTVLIEKILVENKLAIGELAAVAYSSGPGSYTGLRIGLSVAKGICYGAEIPLIEISTLKHMAAAKCEAGQYYFPMLDARRMEVYGALLDDHLNFLIEPFSCIVDRYQWEEILRDKKVNFLGNGEPKSKAMLAAFPNACFVDDYVISASSMCLLAHEKLSKNDFVDLAYHTPFYLKEANVTEAKKKML